MHKKECNVKMPKFIKHHISRTVFHSLFKSLSVHLLITTNLFPMLQGYSFNSYLDILLIRFHPYFFQSAITQERGKILTRKKCCQLFFHEKTIHEISKPYHAQFKSYAMHQKVCNVKMPKFTKGHNSRNIFRIYLKVNQVIFSSLPIYSLSFKAAALIIFEIFC